MKTPNGPKPKIIAVRERWTMEPDGGHGELLLVQRLSEAPPGTLVTVPRGALYQGTWVKPDTRTVSEDFCLHSCYVHTETGMLRHASWLPSDMVVGDVLIIVWKGESDAVDH